MHFHTSAAVACFVAFATIANAHMMMVMPQPFPETKPPPVQDMGANFLCQGKFSGGTPTELKIGSKNNKITFKGTAVHSGGSCQVSITYKEKPTAADFRVITSFHGGCPMDITGNREKDKVTPGDGANDPLDSGLTYDVPDGIPGGKAILAWTWNNRSGNREFYMQCAPIKLTGTPGSKAGLEALPTMVTPNMPGDCKVAEGLDFAYENPGPVVRVGITRKLTVLKGCKGEKGSSSGGGGGGGGDTAPPKTDPPKTDPPKTDPPKTDPPKTDPVTPPTPPPTPPPPVADGGNAGGGGGGSGACTDGNYNCIDGSKFQMCAHGKWQATMPMATGVTCKPGVSQTLFKRSIERLHVRDFGHMEMV